MYSSLFIIGEITLNIFYYCAREIIPLCRLNDTKQVVFASCLVVYGDAEILTQTKRLKLPLAIRAQQRLPPNFMSPPILTLGIKTNVLRHANIGLD